jgi:hypothetical protein
VLTVFDLAEQDTQLKKASSNEYAGSCPSCHGTDRFRVKLTNDRWRFMCRNCWDPQEIHKTGKRAGQKRGFGDEIDYLRHFRKMSFQVAQAFIGGQETIVSNTPAAAVKRYMTDAWQKETYKAMQEHIDRLWSPDDTLALDYARSRGLTDETITQFQFGYALEDGIPRLMIPSINDGRYVCIYRRDLRPDVPKGERWKIAPGSTTNELYLANFLPLRSVPVVLCEDAFSALSVYQECGDLVTVVATGSANCCQTMENLSSLISAPLVLVALDADASGDKESLYWLNRLKNARRLRPLLKDINDMLMDSLDIRQWIEEAIHPPEQIVTPPAADIIEAVELKPLSDHHPLVDDRMPEAFKINTCYRCGRTGEAAWNLSMGMWACICSQIETFDQAQAGKATRIPVSDTRHALAPVQIRYSTPGARGLSEVCSQCGVVADRYGHEAIAYCQKCWNKVEVPWIEQYRALTGQIAVSEEVAS